MRTLKRNKSFFRQFLTSYFVLLVIPFITIFITYFSAQTTIHDEITDSSANSLYQFFNVVDTKLFEMNGNVIQILNNSFVRQYAYDTSQNKTINPFITYEIKTYLNGLPQSDFSDIFVYFYNSNKIISATRSGIDAKLYYDAYYKDINPTEEPEAGRAYENFSEILTEGPENRSRLVVLGTESNIPVLGLVLSKNPSSFFGSSDATAVVALRAERLRQTLESAKFHRQGAIMIFDHNGKLLVSTDPSSTDIDIASYNGRDSLYYDTFNGREYVIQLFPSKVLNCTYVSAVPTDLFWEKLNSLRMIGFVSMLLTMIISAVVAWTLARRSLSPITTLINAISRQTQVAYDRKQKNELEFIGDILKKSLEENDLLSSRIKSKDNNLREDFWLRALQGTLSNSSLRSSQTNGDSLALLSDAFAVILVQVEQVDEAVTGSLATEDGMRTLSFVVANVMQELCGMHHQGFVLGLVPMLYGTVVNFSEQVDEKDALEELHTICHSFQTFIKDKMGIYCTLSYSRIKTGLPGINEAYTQAGKALEYRFSKGKGSLIAYSDIEDKSFSYNSQADSKAVQLLLQHVKEGESGKEKELVAKILDNAFLEGDPSLEAIRCFKYDMVNAVNKIIYDINATELENENHFVKKLLRTETFEEFKEIFITALNALSVFQESSREQHIICIRAEQYIRANYSNPNLNNNEIGKKMSISAPYLSKLFKIQYGTSPLDYLYKVRIEKAKELLKTTEKTIEEIALETGFLGGSALIKMFKKLEGITPGSYRKLGGHYE